MNSNDNVISELRNTITNMKICLGDLRETYFRDGTHPYRDRYLCYAMDYIINNVSIATETLDIVRKDFADYADICYLSVINNNHHWEENCEWHECNGNSKNCLNHDDVQS